mmetsp:Transcript_34749/g.75860  ORF Transcript_34749/g.75860 Transcript_34749/m.75860 type:complete len:112 (-) Transcript_34749:72-407(-)|eukprot:CAMPEP_0116890606 /NCGR_PEP_ID=MMETSP0467-20121206/1141_1 /TAXON_ID=283647 /ORGANISM="Mesodinium pulex, Strain SPMC105" /LENGTH=111 /DNA_ID=CAMNT_0004558527 /DNA_START=1737 /DNA_END=2072 /DNA_ORIENTATION=-
MKYIESLDLSNNCIEKFNKSLFNPHITLVTLNLSHNNIALLDLKFCYLLQTLNASNNNIQSMDCVDLPLSINKLNLSNNKIARINFDFFMRFSNLFNIDIQNNKARITFSN